MYEGGLLINILKVSYKEQEKVNLEEGRQRG